MLMMQGFPASLSYHEAALLTLSSYHFLLHCVSRLETLICIATNNVSVHVSSILITCSKDFG